jgi:hypothetical protein
MLIDASTMLTDGGTMRHPGLRQPLGGDISFLVCSDAHFRKSQVLDLLNVMGLPRLRAGDSRPLESHHSMQFGGTEGLFAPFCLISDVRVRDDSMMERKEGN